MEQKKLLKYLLFLMFAMFFANEIAWKLGWYYHVWWFDVVMHFLGGVWVSLFFLYVFQYILPIKKQLLAVILSVLVIGLLWEFFEYYLNVVSAEPFSIADTLADLLFDLVGAIVVMYYSSKKIMLATMRNV